MTLVACCVIVAAVLSGLGWIKTAWFFSVGYAFSIVAIIALTVVVAQRTLTAFSVVQLLVLAGWGVRLGVFLLRRERIDSYANRDHADRRRMPLPAQLAIWVMCSLLYPAMVAPATLAAQAGVPQGAWTIVTAAGLVMLALGVVIESLADAQKQRAKRVAPRRFVSTGLFGWVRVPNYLGECLVWVGNLIAGLYAVTSPLAWIVVLLGTATLLFIMLGATRRLERTQAERYGEDESFQHYIATVPVLLPWVPLYSIRRLPVPEL